MPKHTTYFPSRHGDQIIWVRNWRLKIAGYQIAGGYTTVEINATIADADYVLQLLEFWHPGAQGFVQAATAHLKRVLYGPIATSVVAVPV